MGEAVIVRNRDSNEPPDVEGVARLLVEHGFLEGDPDDHVDDNRRYLKEFLETCNQEQLQKFVVHLIEISPWAADCIRLTCQLCVLNKAGTFRVECK